MTSADIIKIELSLFQEQYKHLNKENIPASLAKKKQELYDNYKSSFELVNNYNNSSHSSSTFHTNNYNHHAKYKNNQQIAKNHTNRLYIITTDFTENSKIKKQFTAYLNKLTDTNKLTMYPKIQELLNNKDIHNLVYDIVWEFIKKQPKSIYISILKCFSPQMTESYVSEYITNKQWYPPEYAFSNNLLTANEELYDMYCEYVKWKMTVINVIKAFCIIDMCKTFFDTLATDLYSLLIEGLQSITTRHITHFALEELQIILKHCSEDSYIETMNNLQKIDIHELESSSKFLLQDILST